MFSAVFNFFTQLASRAGKMEKLLARIEKYLPENKMSNITLTAHWQHSN